MKILITGGTGFIGAKLCETLTQQGHELIILTRSSGQKKKKGIIYYSFNYTKDEFSSNLIQEIDAVINLAGEDLSSSRWNARKKELIRSSRVLYTKKLVDALNRERKKNLAFFLSTSAVGYYPQTKADNMFDEQSIAGDDFLSRICQEWESVASTLKCTDCLIITRLGIVLGKNGGALKRALPLFQSGTGGRLGHGGQWMSWIHLDDLISAILFLINKKVSGIYNLTSPCPVTNTQFTECLGHVLHRPTFVVVPETMLKIMAGEMASLLLSSQKVFPKELINLKFSFKYEHLLPALESILKA